MRPLLSKHQAQSQFRIGRLTRLRKSHSRIDLARNARLDLLQTGNIRLQLLARPRNRTAPLPLFDLTGFPVPLSAKEKILGFQVPLNAVAVGFYECWTTASARA